MSVDSADHRRSVRLAATVVIAAAVATGCGSSGGDGGDRQVTASSSWALPTVPPDTGLVGPDVIAARFAQQWWAFDTRTDLSPFDARRRATAYATAEFTDRYRNITPAGGPGADWISLAQARAYATVTTAFSAENRPPDTGQRAYRIVTGRITINASRPIEPRTAAVAVICTKTDQGWRVSDAQDR